MKTKALISYSPALPESNLKAYPTARTNHLRVAEQVPPDDITIRRLNALAQQHPFCVHYKVKKYEVL